MTIFDKRMRSKGKVEEDLYFAKLDLDKVAALARKGNASADDQSSSEPGKPKPRHRDTSGSRWPTA